MKPHWGPLPAIPAPMPRHGAASDAARQHGSDQGGALAPPDLGARRAAGGVAAAVRNKPTGPDRPGPADGRGRLPLTGTDFGRIATRATEAIAQNRRAGMPGR